MHRRRAGGEFLAGTPGLAVSDPGKVIVAAVTALLCPEVAGPAEVRAAAGEGIRLLRERREAVLSLIMNNHA